MFFVLYDSKQICCSKGKLQNVSHEWAMISKNRELENFGLAACSKRAETHTPYMIFAPLEVFYPSTTSIPKTFGAIGEEWAISYDIFFN